MRVLAIDPGFGRCGVAIVEKTDGTEVLLYSDCIETHAKTDFIARLHTVVSECRRVAQEFSPEALALEKLFFSKNQKTAMQVAEVRGALLSLASELKLPVYEYSPAEVKVAVAGFGNADKEAIAKMLHALIRIEKEIRHDDEYDAIAVGVTHLAHAPSRAARASS